jgi:hypothetical protein
LRPYLKRIQHNKRLAGKKKAVRVAQVVESLSSKREALSQTPLPPKKKKKKPCSTLQASREMQIKTIVKDHSHATMDKNMKIIKRRHFGE